MKHRVIILLVILSLTPKIYSQDLSLDDLIYLREHTVSEINSFLEAKGWTFSETNDDSFIFTISDWTFPGDSSELNNNSSLTLLKEKYGDQTNLIEYKPDDSALFNEILLNAEKKNLTIYEISFKGEIIGEAIKDSDLSLLFLHRIHVSTSLSKEENAYVSDTLKFVRIFLMKNSAYENYGDSFISDW